MQQAANSTRLALIWRSIIASYFLGGIGLLESFARFVKLYDLRIAPRKTGPQALPLSGKNYSLEDALLRAVDQGRASVKTANGDSIELVASLFDSKHNRLTLLFHRGSPGAADPSYRKSAIERGKRVLTVRQADKGPDEEQSYSAHLVIDGAPIAANVHRAALEEIPGLSIGPIREIIALALGEYKVDFIREGERQETYFAFRPSPLKSETLTGALKKGGASFLTLSRPAKANFVDGSDKETFQPDIETMRLRIIGELTDRNWQQKVGDFLTRANAEGWTDSSVDLTLDNGKRKTVKMEREAAAKEVIFVLSEEVAVKLPLLPCSLGVVDELVEAMVKVINGTRKAGKT